MYNLGLRHPFVAARAVQTLDIVSGGRFDFGIGASWLEEEWIAAELDFKTRGRRVDEALEVCKKLWTDADVSFRGEFFNAFNMPQFSEVSHVISAETFGKIINTSNKGRVIQMSLRLRM